MWSRTIIIVLVVLGGCSYACAQIPDSSLTIQVESNRVLVPVSWAHSVIRCRPDGRGARECWWDGEMTTVRASEHPENVSPFSLGFVPAKSLRLFEDGKEQKIEGVERIVASDNGFRRDNLGTHREWAEVPKGIWNTSDKVADQFRQTSGILDYDLIAYTPPPSPAGSCHHIQLKGKHVSQLLYRHDYCNVHHSPSDLLIGTPEGAKLEKYMEADKDGAIHPSAAANYFYTNGGRARVQIDIEFPFNEVRPRNLSDGISISLLIIAYGSDGKVIARRSEEEWGVWDYAEYIKLLGYDQAVALYTPTRYDTQMELPPGGYTLRIVVGNEPKRYGVTEVPLSIDSYDGKRLGISSLALCKRVRKAGDKPVAEKFVPLVSKGFEFTPAADTAFHKDDSLMVYFELYEPSTSGGQTVSTPPRFEMRITDAKSGTIRLKTEMTAAEWIQPGSSTVPIAVKPVLNTLAPGEYKLEIQASDSAGSTPWREVNFSIE